MNYLVIDNKKYELVKEPKQTFPKSHMWANWTEWKLKIKVFDSLDIQNGSNDCSMKLNNNFYDVQFEVVNKRQLSKFKDHIILQIEVKDFYYEKMDLQDSRDMVISELFD